MDADAAPTGIPGNGDSDFPAGGLPATQPGSRTKRPPPAEEPAGDQLALLRHDRAETSSSARKAALVPVIPNIAITTTEERTRTDGEGDSGAEADQEPAASRPALAALRLARTAPRGATGSAPAASASRR